MRIDGGIFEKNHILQKRLFPQPVNSVEAGGLVATSFFGAD
jgi:hypothetical protein